MCMAMNRIKLTPCIAALVALLLAPGLAWTQPGRISIDLETVAEAGNAAAGARHRVALDATLNPQGSGLHVNSNEPLEDFLIPTVLTLDPPDGITFNGIAWPTPVMLEQQGADQPLAVFEEEFAIGAAFDISSDLAPGLYTVPGRLRYQACDERMCYIPTTANLKAKFDQI